MSATVVRIFDVLARAEQARQALLADGFDAAEVELSIVSDEAGPVAGNFAVGNSPDESVRHTYQRNYATTRETAQCIVSVAAADAVRAGLAASILSRFGARDGDPGARGRPA
jgi:hypothetical protein